MVDPASTFENFLAPVGPEEFLARFWEKDRLYLPRKQSGLFDSIFSLRDVERWLEVTRGGEPDSIIVAAPGGTEEGKKHYRPGDLGIHHVYDLFAKGHSFVLNRLHKTWAPLARLTEMLGAAFSADVGVNVYLTPRGSKTFPVHVDYHDVFILQVYGAKHWRLHELGELPVDGLGTELAYPDYWSHPEKAPLLEEVCLEEGDLLYIPRGMPHSAVAKDAPSLHLTVSIHPFYWVDFLKTAVEQACFASPTLRKALPPAFVGDPRARKGMREVFAAALAELNQNVAFDETLAVLMRRRVCSHGYPQDGHLEQLARLDELGLSSELERRPNILCTVDVSEEYKNSSIRFGTTHVRGPLHLRRAFDFIRDRETLRVAEIPGLDDKGKLTLARRLIREGLLRFAGSGHREVGLPVDESRPALRAVSGG